MALKEGSKEITRRRFLGYAVGIVGGITALVLGIPVIASLLSQGLAKKKAEGEWVELGNINDFDKDKPTLVKWTARKQDAWVVRTEDKSAWVYTQDGENFTVWNPRCTHLGCGVYYDEQRHTLNSPCHGGVFALPDGKVIAGPPPRPLDTLPMKVEEGKLFTIYKDFKIGIPGKIERT